ncbi:MAG: trimeric autotransporter adhesin [Verrucomicrobiota bacterium]
MFPPRSLLLALGCLFCCRSAFTQTVNSTWAPPSSQPNYSDPNNWSPAVVPNNTAATHYNVTAGRLILVDIDATISNLSLEGNPLVSVWGVTFTVLDQTTSSVPTATISIGPRDTHGARFNAGSLSAFSNGTLSGNYDVSGRSSPTDLPGILQFNGADIRTLANGHVRLTGAFARIQDESGNDALRNLTRIDSTGSLALDYAAITNAPVQNDGTVTVGLGSPAASFTAAAGLINFDSTTRRISGGIFNLIASVLRFNGADIVAIGNEIHLSQAARIEDMGGNNGLRNLAQILPSGSLFLNQQNLAISGQFRNDGSIWFTNGSVLSVPNLTNFDPGSRTFTGGQFVLRSSAQLLFGGADIVHNASYLNIGGGTIKDLNGANALRNFSDNLAGGEFVLSTSVGFTAPGDFTNAGIIRTEAGGIDRGNILPPSRFLVPTGFKYTQTNGLTSNYGSLTADRVDIFGGSFEGGGTVKGNMIVKNATLMPSQSTFLQNDLTLEADAHFRYQFGSGGPCQINGKATLGGTLDVDIRSEQFVASTALLSVLKSSMPLIGSFANAPNGTRIPTTDGKGSVLVTYDANTVYLSQYQATPPPAQLLNISSRAFLSAKGDDTYGNRAVIIGGFIITGNTAKQIVLRALGPSLAAFGLDPVLRDPVLELHSSDGALLTSNDNWRENEAAISGTGLAPTDDHEAALRVTLAPGSYTAIVKEKTGLAGYGLVEVYDLAKNTISKLANISARGWTDSSNVLIGGITVGGSGQANDDIVVRGMGPQLKGFGIPNALDDPTVEVRDGNGIQLAFNDDSPTGLGSTGLAPYNPKESAVLMSLPPGSYTAIVRAKGNAGGVALVEFYDLRQ